MIHCREDKTEGAWSRFIEAMHSGEEVEIDEEMYYYWLEALPPVFMYKVIDGKKYEFGFAEGAEPVTVFWRKDGRFFCRRTGIMNPCA
jgi:hypothetical protein